MNSLNEYAAYCLERMRQGAWEDAFFRLIEAHPAVLPVLIEAFAKDENREIRALIVECIWQHRRPETIGFLAEVLRDPEPAVWKAALDGLVSIGGSEAIRALQAFRVGISSNQPKHAITVEWVDETLELLQERMTE